MRKIANWLEEHTSGESLDMLTDLAEAAALLAPGGAGIPLAALIRKRKYREVCEYEVPLQKGSEVFRCLRQAQALFQAYPDLDVGIDREIKCLADFLETEALCRETNELFKSWHNGLVAFEPRIAGIYHRASRIIASVLGEAPKLSELMLRFGPGATSLTKKREASIKRKLGSGVSCSRDLIGYASALLSEMPAFAKLNSSSYCDDGEGMRATVNVVIHEAVMTLIEKNYKKLRTTETQPVLNGMIQLAVGDEISRRCRRVVGLDLTDQTLNQRLARIGSLTGALATLDQSSASNCQAYQLVKSLFPLDWFELLRVARVGTTSVPYLGSVRLEMFAGMGNGSTFPVESLVFYSLARAASETVIQGDAIVSVYGDDIIVETEAVETVLAILAHAGFKPSREKSFWQGPFRESCGADFFLGEDVRPVFCKEVLSPRKLFALHNGFVRRGFATLAEMVRLYLHPAHVQWGPDGYGDGHLIGPWTGRPYRRHLGYEGFVFDTFGIVPKRHWDWHPGDAILPGYSTYMSGGGRTLTGEPSGSELSRDNLYYIARLHGGVGEIVITEGIPFSRDEDGSNNAEVWGPLCLLDSEDEGVWQGEAKACTFPGVRGYQRISVYVLDPGPYHLREQA